MKKIALLLLLTSFNTYSQKNSNDTLYIIIDNLIYKNLYIVKKDKTNNHVTIKVYNQGKNKQITNKNNKVVIPKMVLNNFYEYYSIDKPKNILTIKNLNAHSIQYLSINQNKLKYNQTIIFMEKLKNSTYNLWSTKVSYQE